MNWFLVRLKVTHIPNFSFWDHFAHFFPDEIILLIDFKQEKAMTLRAQKNLKNFVKAARKESCFGMPTFYIDFCSCQLKQCHSY